MLKILFSNKFEILLEALKADLAEAPASVFAPEHLIVPSSALRRRLTLSIADRYGICANVQFAYLAQWLWQQIERVVPSVGAQSPFTPPVLAWRIYAIFGEAEFLAAQPRLGDYLGQADAVMRHDLAARAAALLEQYLTYRPDWLAAWSEGRNAAIALKTPAEAADQQWQAALWRRITMQLGTAREHPAARFLAAVAARGQEVSARSELPQRAHIFCLPTLPPLYMDILRQLARWVDLRLYVLNPCQEYWFDIVDRRRLSHLAAQGKAQHQEQGNQLLAAWGKQTQAQIELLLGSAAEETVDVASFASSAGDTLLAQVHNAILDLQELAPASVVLAPQDRSIEVHVCHSLTRELEVLQDQLLDIFSAPGAPRASEVLVVTPDLEAAAPLIDAVFGNVPEQRRIAYAISGRARSTVNATARALLALLAVAASRFQASAVFDLLQQSLIGRHFGIEGDDLATVHDWFDSASMRWGIDAQHRASLGFPATSQHSLDDGLQRLFLGYALPTASIAPLAGRLPSGAAEGAEALVLGAFGHFIEQLVGLQRDLCKPRGADAWLATLSGVLDTFMTPTDAQLDDHREVGESLRELHANMTRGGLSSEVPLEVMQRALQAALDDPARGAVPTGAVTFSSLASLRSLPYAVICAIGLNDGKFPGVARPDEFDLMASHARLGDRQRRHDERNLFLDLLLAARQRFYLSYTGRSVRDNSMLPASVVVAELLDYLAAATASAPATDAAIAAARRRLVIEHPLQAFSLSAFNSADRRQRSFNAEYCLALQHSLGAVADMAPQAGVARPGEQDAHAVDDSDGDESVADDAQAEAHANASRRAFFTTPLAATGS